MRATIQFCTYNRARLLERVLHACFEQTVAAGTYEVVVVDDGSSDDTPAVIEAAKARATTPFVAIRQPNAGLARGRNVGIAASHGERIIFIDDDVLPMPNFVAEHLRAAERDPDIVVRGAVIEVENFERLPPPFWSPRNYSGNWFWTSNVSASRQRLDRAGGFDESFSEYGWEDIELGLRLRALGTRGIFNRQAVAFHYKPKSNAQPDLEALIRQKRAQARTARVLAEKHPTWRVALATGDNLVQRSFHRASRLLHLEDGWRMLLRNPKTANLARNAIAAGAYFDELIQKGEG